MAARLRFAMTLVLLAALTGACNPAPANTEHAMASASAAPGSKTGTGTGVIKAIDLQKATITLTHEPIEALGWPAMTMTFKADPPSLLQTVQAGQTVSFDVTVTDNTPVITGLRK